ncbi:MAG: hypothetical protein JHD35_04965 [Sphingopyxis sp.]|nr:hypothetical protein [Sphingopyxis sp.]
MRQKKLLEQFVDIVARVSMTRRMHQWLGQALKENSDLIETEHARVLERLRRDRDAIRERMKQAILTTSMASWTKRSSPEFRKTILRT